MTKLEPMAGSALVEVSGEESRATRLRSIARELINELAGETDKEIEVDERRVKVRVDYISFGPSGDACPQCGGTGRT